MYSKLQYISQGESAQEQVNNIQTALDAGCDWVQLRSKDFSLLQETKLAENVRRLTQHYRARLIINDYPGIAKEIDADGVHIGLNDGSVKEVRKIIGEDKIIGRTANTLKDVIEANKLGCNYVGLGPFQHTTTKKNLSPVLGLEGYAKICSEVKKQGITVPIYAIGGITQNDTQSLFETGIHGVAISGALTHSPNKKEIIETIKAQTYAST